MELSSISYGEMAFLRELVSKEKLRIWKEEWYSRLRSTCKEKNEAVEIFTKWDEEKCLGVPLNNLDCCRKLLCRFSVVEQNIQVALAK